ncbi:MAG: glycosyltransferase family 4 protein [Bacteroidota bacterium]|nr:glycosyltransferase family 4 protein [Bacteroidota bacterium]
MNILYLCEEYPPGKNGGIGTMVNVLGRELVRQGHNVYVAGLYPPGYSQADYDEDKGVKVWRLRYKADIGLIKGNYSFFDTLYLKLYKYSALLHFDTIASARYLFGFIKDLVKEYNIDIIEMPDWNTFLHNSLTTSHIPSFEVPLVIKLNGSDSYFAREMNTRINSRIFKAEQALLNRANAIASASLYTAKKTKEIFKVSKEITVLYNSINIPSNVEKSAHSNTVIFTGALVRKKGIISLLQAWNLANTRCPRANLHIYGKGPVHKLKKLLTKDSGSSVFFHEHVSREILLRELSNSTVAIFPSYSECFSFAPLEAMAAGCAVIYSSRSSGPELITHNEDGFLIDPDDINAIADAIVLLLTNKDLRDKIAKAGKKTISEKFNITISARQHISFYNKVIQAGFKRKDGH